uniref:ShKT domain-containing protein n=1 Tax=Acrobeloides nanus TaxID=290746 RepID=A0A914CZJ0_9BILA
MEVLRHPFLTTKSTSTTIPSTKLTTSAISKVAQYSGCYDRDMTAHGGCPTKDDNRCAKGSWIRYACPESCGLCTENGLPRPYPPNATCFDAKMSTGYCPLFKDRGTCDDPQDYHYGLVRTLCAYTCGAC